MASTRRPKMKMKEIQSLDEIPAFQSEAEESEFWSTHSLGEGILTQMGPLSEEILPRDHHTTRPIVVRLDEDVIRRLKLLAQRKGKGYQTLLQEFVIERLNEEEKREGLVGR